MPPARSKLLPAILASLMQERGFNQVQLSQRAGLAVSRLNNYLQGKYRTIKPAHPDDEAMIEQLRAIHNGEMPDAYDPETGRTHPQPRVWRSECEWQAVWIVELPA